MLVLSAEAVLKVHTNEVAKSTAVKSHFGMKTLPF